VLEAAAERQWSAAVDKKLALAPPTYLLNFKVDILNLVGLGRTLALHHRSSAPCQVRERVRCRCI
jgi:hypothetical protein